MGCLTRSCELVVPSVAIFGETYKDVLAVFVVFMAVLGTVWLWLILLRLSCDAVLGPVARRFGIIIVVDLRLVVHLFWPTLGWRQWTSWCLVPKCDNRCEESNKILLYYVYIHCTSSSVIWASSVYQLLMERSKGSAWIKPVSSLVIMCLAQ